MGKKLSELTLEELWQLFPIILTEHKDYWKEGTVTVFCSWIFYLKVIWNRNITAVNFWRNCSLLTYYVYK